MPTSEFRIIEGVNVEIRRSTRRRRSLEARYEQGQLVVLIPASLRPAQERQLVTDLVRRVVRKSASRRNDDDLMRRAHALSKRHVPGAPKPTSVRWVSNMTTRWGSTTPSDGSIRLSDAMVDMPQYVIDNVLLHEVIHLIHRGHGPEFQSVLQRYPDHDRAEAYLSGASFGARQLRSAPEADAVDGDVMDEADLQRGGLGG